MKKTNSKKSLKLSRETIRVLDKSDLEQADGGTWYDFKKIYNTSMCAPMPSMLTCISCQSVC